MINEIIGIEKCLRESIKPDDSGRITIADSFGHRQLFWETEGRQALNEFLENGFALKEGMIIHRDGYYEGAHSYDDDRDTAYVVEPIGEGKYQIRAPNAARKFLSYCVAYGLTLEQAECLKKHFWQKHGRIDV